MGRAGLLAAAALTLTGAGPRVYRSAEVYRDYKELNGKRIRVAGYVRYCEPRSCAIGDEPYDPADPGGGASLSIGSDRDRKFDRRAKRLVGRRIVMEGTLDTRCLLGLVGDVDAEVVICADRAEMLKAPKLIAAR